MHTISTRTIAILSLLSIAAYSVAITSGAVAEQPKRMLMMTGKPLKVPNPESCIKLLEDIMQRMHSLPVMAKSPLKQQIAAAQSDGTVQQGPTNQLLAIKPPESTVSADLFARRVAKKAKVQAVGGMFNRKDAQSFDDQAASYEGKPRQIALNENLRSAGGMAGSTLSYAANGFNGSNIADKLSVDEKLDEGRYGRLANSLGKFYGATQQMQNMMQEPSGRSSGELKSLSRSAPRAEASSVSAASGKILISDKPQIIEFDRERSKDFRQAPSAPQLVSQAAVSDERNYSSAKEERKKKSSRDSFAPLAASPAHGMLLGQRAQLPASAPPGYFQALQQEKAQSAGKNLIAPAEEAESGSAATAPPLNPELYKHIRQPLNASNFPAAPQEAHHARYSFSPAQKAKSEIALLPPNVIMGIPLVHLGSSAKEASHALSSIGKVKSQTINAWTVWVFNRPNSSEPAMQVYIRHGLVEALRIFDSSLVAPDFGVRLGDELSAVKGKFGEPAFMICEPNSIPEPAQNYVYPISQVGFELSRASKSTAPKVVSILIFTVK